MDEHTHNPTPYRVNNHLADKNECLVWTDESHGSVLVATCHGINKAINAAFIVRAVNACQPMVDALKNARNVLAGLVSGDLKEIKADSPALREIRQALAMAEVRP